MAGLAGLSTYDTVSEQRQQWSPGAVDEERRVQQVASWAVPPAGLLMAKTVCYAGAQQQRVTVLSHCCRVIY